MLCRSAPSQPDHCEESAPTTRSDIGLTRLESIWGWLPDHLDEM